MKRPAPQQDQELMRATYRLATDRPQPGDAAMFFGWLESELHFLDVRNRNRNAEQGTDAQALEAILKLRDDGKATVKTHTMPA